MAAFFLRGTDLQNKFEMTRGTPPLFRLMDKTISLLYSAPKLSTPMAMFMNAANHHKIACGEDDNTFEFDMMDLQDHLKGHRIKLAHNLNPQNAPTDLAALDYCPLASDVYGANISALRTPRRQVPSCEVCFQRHDVDRCPARGSGENKFIHPDALRRGKLWFVLVLFKHLTETLTVAQGPGVIWMLVFDGDHAFFILIVVLKHLLTFGQGSSLLFNIRNAFGERWHDVDVQIVVFDFRNQRAEVCHF